MKIVKQDYKNGWLVGDFKPSLLETNFMDIGILELEEGTKGDSHYHKEHTEYNYIISGEANVGGHLLSKGDCFIYEPLDKSDVVYTKDTVILCIKTPSKKGDKFFE